MMCHLPTVVCMISRFSVVKAFNEYSEDHAVVLNGLQGLLVGLCIAASSLVLSCRVIVLYLVPTIYRFKYYFAWAVAEAGLTLSGFNYNGCSDRGVFAWDRYVNTRIAHVEFQTSLAKLPEHWNICTGLFLRQCKSICPVKISLWCAKMVIPSVYRCYACQSSHKLLHVPVECCKS